MRKLIPVIGYRLISLIGRTLRLREVNPYPEYRVPGAPPVAYAFWHGDQFIPCYHHRGQGVLLMVSQSKDGEIQEGIVRRFGYRTVRGSSTRGGERALIEAIRHVRGGVSAAFAVDGPRGPVHQVKPGIIALAQKTGAALIPVSAYARRYFEFSRAWDRYRLPLPFTRAVIAYGTPILMKDRDPEEARMAAENALENLRAFTEKDYWSNDVRPYLDHHPRPRILIVQPSRLGDVIFSLPVLAALKKRFPHAWFGWVVDERCAPMIEGNPLIDEVIVFDRTKVSLPYILRFRRELRAKHIDVSIDLHGLAKSAFLVLCAGARFRIGSASTRGMKEFSWLFSREIGPEREDMHCVERHLAVARHLGCETAAPEYPVGRDEAAERRIEDIFRQHGIQAGEPVILVHPGGGWISRRWFPERFSELISRLVRNDHARVMLIGGREGGAGEQGLNELIKEKVTGPVIDLTGELTLKELVALMRRCTAFVGNEAGPMHIAVALNVRVVALIGPTDPGRTGPYGGRTTVVRHRVECQPCRERSCADRSCMKGISVDEVYAAVRGTW